MGEIDTTSDPKRTNIVALNCTLIQHINVWHLTSLKFNSIKFIGFHLFVNIADKEALSLAKIPLNKAKSSNEWS